MVKIVEIAAGRVLKEFDSSDEERRVLALLLVCLPVRRTMSDLLLASSRESVLGLRVGRIRKDTPSIDGTAFCDSTYE